MTRLYFACALRISTSTTIVFAIFVDLTYPIFSLRCESVLCAGVAVACSAIPISFIPPRRRGREAYFFAVLFFFAAAFFGAAGFFVLAGGFFLATVLEAFWVAAVLRPEQFAAPE